MKILAYPSIFHKFPTGSVATSSTVAVTWADPGFFLGGGEPLRNGVTEFFVCRIPVVIESRRSSGEGRGVGHPCTLSLDLPLS